MIIIGETGIDAAKSLAHEMGGGVDGYKMLIGTLISEGVA
jgi:hypothetical protein